MTESTIRTSKHYFQNFANPGKIANLSAFLIEQRAAVQFYINHLWNNRIEWSYSGSSEIHILDVNNQQYDCPSYLYNKDLIPPGSPNLYARALKCAANQACGIIKSVFAERIKLQKRKQILLDAKITPSGKLEKDLEKTFSKPEMNSTFGVELNSICSTFAEGEDKHFDCFLVLNSLGKTFGNIALPIKYTKLSNKYKVKAKRMASFLVFDKSIDIRWTYQAEKKTSGDSAGIDTGINNVAYLSDGQHTTADKHNHTLSTIIDKISRTKPGSKARLRAYDHRKNYIHWSINQLNLTNIKEIHIEKIFDFGRGKAMGRSSHWCNNIIEKKIESVCYDQGVLVYNKTSPYKSQRCFSCELVSKKNRKGDEFKCIGCGNCDHAGRNSALNQTLNLPSTYHLKDVLKSKKSFFWKEEGFFDKDGQELTVSDSKEKVKESNWKI